MDKDERQAQGHQSQNTDGNLQAGDKIRQFPTARLFYPAPDIGFPIPSSPQQFSPPAQAQFETGSKPFVLSGP
jgi:hypothetical protein